VEKGNLTTRTPTCTCSLRIKSNQTLVYALRGHLGNTPRGLKTGDSLTKSRGKADLALSDQNDERRSRVVIEVESEGKKGDGDAAARWLNSQTKIWCKESLSRGSMRSPLRSRKKIRATSEGKEKIEIVIL